MEVKIDGIEYVPVTKARITLNGVAYAMLADQSPVTSGIAPHHILDQDGDNWYPVRSGPDAMRVPPMYFCLEVKNVPHKTRDFIRASYGIESEEF